MLDGSWVCFFLIMEIYNSDMKTTKITFEYFLFHFSFSFFNQFYYCVQQIMMFAKFSPKGFVMAWNNTCMKALASALFTSGLKDYWKIRMATYFWDGNNCYLFHEVNLLFCTKKSVFWWTLPQLDIIICFQFFVSN